MFTIERLAYESNLRWITPISKMIYAFSTLGICLLGGSVEFSLIVWAIMTTSCIYGSGLSLNIYLKMCFVPLVFLLVGTLTIAISFSSEANGLLYFPVGGDSFIQITESGLAQGIDLFAKSMACVSCLYFFYVTVTIDEMIGLLNRWRVPEVFINLLVLTYRLIFILLGIIEQMNCARKVRLGNNSRGSSFRSGMMMGATVFTRGVKVAMNMAYSMEVRGYQGTWPHAAEVQPIHRKEAYILVGYVVGLVGLYAWIS